MNRKLEKSNSDKVLRRFTNHLKMSGFIRTKPTLWVRENDHIVQFIHTHKYTFGPCYRIHTCIRPYNSSRDFVALMGPTEKELQADASFEFNGDLCSVEQCAVKMASFVQLYSECWFKKWSDPRDLISVESPLDDLQKNDLEEALSGKINQENICRTKRLLKIE